MYWSKKLERSKHWTLYQTIICNGCLHHISLVPLIYWTFKSLSYDWCVQRQINSYFVFNLIINNKTGYLSYRVPVLICSESHEKWLVHGNVNCMNKQKSLVPLQRIGRRWLVKIDHLLPLGWSNLKRACKVRYLMILAFIQKRKAL